MIAFLLADGCPGCGTCVEICPTAVFDAAPGRPATPRPQDCQTCFMCELYCEADAIFVGPDATRLETFVPADVVAGGLMGEMRRHHGWHEWAGDPRYPHDHRRVETVFQRAGEMARAASLPSSHDGESRPDRKDARCRTTILTTTTTMTPRAGNTTACG